MKVDDPGHGYIVDNYDSNFNSEQIIYFMKRIGENYPGNFGPGHPGTNCQELIRVIIDRVKYLDNQIPSWHNKEVLKDLRHALLMFEDRAADRRSQKIVLSPRQEQNIEQIPACRKCGHIQCKEHS